MNKDPIFHLPHGPVLLSTCQGLVTRLDEEGRREGRIQRKERFLSRHLEEVEREKEMRGAGDTAGVNDPKSGIRVEVCTS